MAMLAEPRRKQKFSINPQGTSWSNDESKFGQKMLERMGWSKGKGLGANENGRVDHVKISLKNDQKGVGCSKNYSDNWIAHQDDFNSLLESLNQGHGEEGDNSSNTKQVISLEKKSQSSRNRVHYGKFTRGKDLSSRSHSDLKCIFGKRTEKSVLGEVSARVESAESSGSEDCKMEVSHGFTTIKSTSNLQEYFAKKMAARKGHQYEDIEEDNSAERDEKTSEQYSSVLDDDQIKHENKKKKKKSKKRRKDNHIVESDKNVTDSIDTEVDSLDSPDKGRCKKLGHQQKNIGLEENQEKEVKKKKKKKSVKSSKEEDPESSSPGAPEARDIEPEGRKQKKAEKRKRNGEEAMKVEAQDHPENASPKKKKKKKKTSVEKSCDLTVTSSFVKEMAEVTQTSPKKKLRKRTGDLPNVIKNVCKSFKGANVASIHGYDKTSMSEREMLKKIEDRHKLILRHMKTD